MSSRHGTPRPSMEHDVGRNLYQGRECLVRDASPSPGKYRPCNSLVKCSHSTTMCLCVCVCVCVNIAARIMGAAAESEVLVSSVVRDLCLGSGLEFVPRGSHPLKGVPGDWDLYAARFP